MFKAVPWVRAPRPACARWRAHPHQRGSGRPWPQGKVRSFWGFPDLDPQRPASLPSFPPTACVPSLRICACSGTPQPEHAATFSLSQVSFSKFPLTYFGGWGGTGRVPSDAQRISLVLGGRDDQTLRAHDHVSTWKWGVGGSRRLGKGSPFLLDPRAVEMQGEGVSTRININVAMATPAGSPGRCPSQA